MEKPIVVFVDAEQKIVHLYGGVNQSIPFDHAFILPAFLRGKTVLYIMDINEVSGDDVMEVVSELKQEEAPSQRPFIHSLCEEYIRVPDIRLTLSGKRDSKPVEQFGYDVFERSKLLRQMLLDGKIEIISESEAVMIRKKLPPSVSKDKSLDSIIVKTSVDDILNRDPFEDENTDMIDGEGPELETEADKNIREIQRGRPSTDS